MSEFDEKYNKIIEDISKNIKDEKELQFVKEKMNELSAIFINMFNQVNNSSEKRITDLEKNQKGLEEKINKVEKFIEDMKKDIYDEYDEEDYEFEIICPYCNHIFTSEIKTEENEEIECPECHNIIELDWSGDLDDEHLGCNGGCSSCHGCGSDEIDEETDIDDDM